MYVCMRFWNLGATTSVRTCYIHAYGQVDIFAHTWTNMQTQRDACRHNPMASMRLLHTHTHMYTHACMCMYACMYTCTVHCNYAQYLCRSHTDTHTRVCVCVQCIHKRLYTICLSLSLTRVCVCVKMHG